MSIFLLIQKFSLFSNSFLFVLIGFLTSGDTKYFALLFFEKVLIHSINSSLIEFMTFIFLKIYFAITKYGIKINFIKGLIFWEKVQYNSPANYL